MHFRSRQHCRTSRSAVAGCSKQCADKYLRPKPTGRTSRLLSCHRSVGGLRPANPALSFAKLRSDKNQVPHLGSTFRAGSLQSLWCTNVRHVLPGRRKVGRGSCGGCARCLQNERRKSAGRRQADRSQLHVVMSGVVDSGRESGHPKIDANDRPCVKTHTSAKCRKHNSPARHRTSRVQYDLTLRDAIARRYFYVWRVRWSFRTAKTHSRHECLRIGAAQLTAEPIPPGANPRCNCLSR
jgi:hypothetical protein